MKNKNSILLNLVDKRNSLNLIDKGNTYENLK